MLKILRWLFIVLLSSAFVWFMLLISQYRREKYGTDENLIKNISKTVQKILSKSEECRVCHTDVFEEWSSSPHRSSSSNPVFQGYLSTVYRSQQKDCFPCHSPAPLFLLSSWESTPQACSERMAGIDCLSCHAEANGVASSRTLSSPSCQPVEESRLISSKICIFCHKGVEKTWDGRACQPCHMPMVQRLKQSKGKSHRFFGGKDDLFLSSAVEMRLSLEPGLLKVDITNHGAAHAVPGERHFRVLVLLIKYFNDKEDSVVSEDRLVIRDVVPFNSSIIQEVLLPGKTFTRSYPIIKETGAIEARLLYKPYPYLLDHEAKVVVKQRISVQR